MSSDAKPLTLHHPPMPKYLIKREIPNAGKMSSQDVQGAAQQSCDVLQELGPHIQWVHSYVTDDTIHCIYIAPSEDLVRKHAKQSGFPATHIMEVKAVIDPTTAEG